VVRFLFGDGDFCLEKFRDVDEERENKNGTRVSHDPFCHRISVDQVPVNDWKANGNVPEKGQQLMMSFTAIYLKKVKH